MLYESFSLASETLEKKLDDFLYEILGEERFSPDEKRLEKYFSPFKEIFKEFKVPLFIVGGTNGKGEVSLLMEDLFLKNGYAPMLWNSPHILTVRERMSFKGKAVDGEVLYHKFKIHRKKSEELSFYEFLFYIFCELCAENLRGAEYKKPILLLEVGLGGRRDATNFFDCAYSVLTNISFDHTNILGQTLPEILREKMQIIRPGGFLFSGISQENLGKELEDFCSKKEVTLYNLWQRNPEYLNFILEERDNFKERNGKIAKSVVSHFLKNHSLLKEEEINLSLPKQIWGRPLKMTYNHQKFILIGSHNLDGLRHLVEWAKEKSFSQLWLSFSRQEREELKKCFELMRDSSLARGRICITSFDHPKATTWSLLEEVGRDCFFGEKAIEEEAGKGKKIEFEENLSNLIQRQLQSSRRNRDREPILVAGSYYFVGSLARLLGSSSLLLA